MGTESVVIAFVLAEHPSHLTIPELSLAINRQACGEFADDDTVERAISELVGAGLLHVAAGFRPANPRGDLFRRPGGGVMPAALDGERPLTVAQRFASNLLRAREGASLSQEEVGFRASTGPRSASWSAAFAWPASTPSRSSAVVSASSRAC
jgi:hypothetical protein